MLWSSQNKTSSHPDYIFRINFTRTTTIEGYSYLLGKGHIMWRLGVLMLVLAGIKKLGEKLTKAYSGTNQLLTFKGENSYF